MQSICAAVVQPMRPSRTKSSECARPLRRNQNHSLTRSPQARIRKHLSHDELVLYVWISNQGTTTADDVVVNLKKTPQGALGLNDESWNHHPTSHVAGLALKHPLNPGTTPILICSVSFGVAYSREALIRNEQSPPEFHLEILARDVPRLDLTVAFTHSELLQRVMKHFEKKKA